MISESHVTIDFETRSAAPITSVGSWRYVVDPSTEPICLAYTLDQEDEPKVWIPDWVDKLIDANNGTDYDLYIGKSCPYDLWRAISEGARVEAHNAFFERAIWVNIMVPIFGWPIIEHDQWRCSAAKAAAVALPRSLDGATSVLETAKKDLAGKNVMMRVSKPRKVLKGERKTLISSGHTERTDNGWDHPELRRPLYFWREDPEDFWRTIEYCRQDVRAERALSQALPELSQDELTTWKVDQSINLRGVPIDSQMAQAAIDISNTLTKRATSIAQKLSNNAFETLGQRNKVLAWLKSQGVEAQDLKAATVKDLLSKDSVSINVKTVLKCKRTCSKTSVAKYSKMLETIDPKDDRVRDAYMYHGAATGRWTGRFLQTQNLPRGKMVDPDTLCGIIKTGDPELVDLLYSPSDPMSVLSWAIRGAIYAPEGKDLVCADYSGIEARGALWLVNDVDGLSIFSREKGQPGIYREMAGTIYNVDPASINKKTIKGAEQRQIGKEAILGLGYGMGAPKFQSTCRDHKQNMDANFAEHVVNTYRSRFSKIVKCWAAMHATAVKAVENPGMSFKVMIFTNGQREEIKGVRYAKKGRFLFCRLPSGRRLAYFDPRLENCVTPWGSKSKRLTYKQVESMTRKWMRVDTYGGRLFQNVVQALSRDLEASAIVRLELGNNPYDVVMHTHDEIVAEVDEDKGSVKEFERLISLLPDWAGGFPLTAEGWRGKRYRK